MSLVSRPVILLAFGLSLLATALHAEDKTKLDSEKAKEMLDKLVGEARKAAGKLKEDDKVATLWPRSKETMALPQAEYLKRAESAMKSMDAEIVGLAEGESVVNTRDYFKAQVEALKLRLAYCRQDMERLRASGGEEAFRVKQKKFDRVMVFLADNIQLAKDESGL